MHRGSMHSSSVRRGQDIAVLIAGSGPTGLTLAVELARRGVPYRIVEKSPEHFAGARGKGLQPRTQEVLDDLGVLDRVYAAGGPYPALRAYQGGRVVWEGRMDEIREPTPEVPYPSSWMLPQWRTGQILRERLAELGGAPVETATEVTRFEQDGDGVTAVLSRGGSTEQVRAGYLVGADGGRSTVRRILGVGFAGETRESQRMVVADVRAEGIGRDAWHTWIPEGQRVPRAALCPLAGTDTFQLTVQLDEGQAPELALPGLQHLVEAATGEAGIRLREVVWSSLFRPSIRMAERFRVGRVFLAGDAAHVHSPAGGQGLNTGIQDAYNLGWKLAAAAQGAPAELVESYEAERLPVAAGVLGISTKLHTKGLRGDADAHRRDDPQLHQLTLTYRDGPLSVQEYPAAGPVQAGDRAPDAPCHTGEGKPYRLFDAFRGPHFTVLVFGERWRALPEKLSRRHQDRDRLRAHTVVRQGEPAGEGALVDTDGHAHRGYGIAAPDAAGQPAADALVLVRPDGYIGLMADHPRAVHAYLQRVIPRP